MKLTIMKMNKTIKIIIILFAFCSINFAQEKAAVASEIRPAEKSRIEGQIPNYDIRVNKLDYLRTLARPELFLTFGENRKFDLESVKEIKNILDLYWEDVIKFYYRDDLEKPINNQQSAADPSEWMIQQKKNIDKLRQVSINTSGDKRKISTDEATEMLNLLDKTSSDLLEKAKQSKRVYTNVKINRKSFAKSGGNCSRVTGTTEVNVTFDKSAKITEVEIRKPSGCNEFDQNAVEAAKGLKFEPAKADDEPITVIKTVVYNYNIH